MVEKSAQNGASINEILAERNTPITQITVYTVVVNFKQSQVRDKC